MGEILKGQTGTEMNRWCLLAVGSLLVVALFGCASERLSGFGDCVNNSHFDFQLGDSKVSSKMDAEIY